MKRVLLIAALAATSAVAPGLAQARGAAACGLPDASPLWVDFAGSTVTFRTQLFARAGVIAALDAPALVPPLVSAGAQPVFWHMTLPNLVGTPDAPADPGAVPAAADALYDRAAAATGCQTPLIALNELLAPTAPPPLTPQNAQYRAAVLALLQELAVRGARPFLLLPSNPNTNGELADWWRQAAQVSDLVREVYLPAPSVIAQGPILGNRAIRLKLRAAVASLTAIGVEPARIGLMLGFQSGGAYGRVGLQPLAAWLEYVKWSTLAARQVAAETGVATLWSWGWGTFSQAGVDADKPSAACVYLWTRDPALCDAPATAPPEFDQSLTEGQISSLPEIATCSLAAGTIPGGAVERLTALTGDRRRALSALLARLVQRARVPLRAADVLAAERLIVRVRFHGRRALYLDALASRNVPLAVARGILGDEVARARLVQVAAPESVSAWTAAQATQLLDSAICRGDELPAAADAKLANLVPFLKITRS